MRVERIGDATLYFGDCLDVLPGVAPVGAVITDPPYEAEAHTKGRRLLGEQKNGVRSVEFGALDFEPMTEATRLKSAALAGAICGGWMLTFCQAEAVDLWRRSHVLAGGAYKRAMVWVKPDGTPQFTGDRPGMGYESIVASWFGAGRSRWNGGGRHGVFTHAQRDSNAPKEHMTQKPLALMVELVSLFSEEGAIVCDPFMGSGTTGVAALQAGRRFIGIERDPKYFEVACARMRRAMDQGRLTLPPRAKQVQVRLPMGAAG